MGEVNKDRNKEREVKCKYKNSPCIHNFIKNIKWSNSKNGKGKRKGKNLTWYKVSTEANILNVKILTTFPKLNGERDKNVHEHMSINIGLEVCSCAISKRNV